MLLFGVFGLGMGSPRQWSQPQAAGIEGVFGECPEGQGLHFEWSFVKTGAGLGDLYGFLTTQKTLCFYKPICVAAQVSSQQLMISWSAPARRQLSFGYIEYSVLYHLCQISGGEIKANTTAKFISMCEVSPRKHRLNL